LGSYLRLCPQRLIYRGVPEAVKIALAGVGIRGLEIALRDVIFGAIKLAFLLTEPLGMAAGHLRWSAQFFSLQPSVWSRRAARNNLTRRGGGNYAV